MNTNREIRVVIAEDQTILRQGLRSLIEQSEEIKIIGEAADGREAVELVGDKHPDIVIMDVAMPNLNGIEAARLIKKKYPESRVLALSQHADEPHVRRMLQAGARAYLQKESIFEELAQAIHEVAAGRYYLSREISSRIIQQYVENLPSAEDSQARVLSNREREVLQLVAEGNTTREIAADLGISVKTVETHRQQIMNKLDIHSIAGLTRFALREGIAFL